MTQSKPVRVALLPEGIRPWLADAIRDGGGVLGSVADSEVLVWAQVADPEGLRDALQGKNGEGRNIKWVQLPWAGIEPYVDVVKAESERVWTCAKGVYAGPVAEHALTLLLAGLRGLGDYARATSWQGPQGTNLLRSQERAKVVILGGGGITERLLPLLQPFDADVTVLRRHVAPMHGATRVLDISELDNALSEGGGAIGVVLALALTPETVGIIGRAQLERMHPKGWLVNVARGRHVVTDDLLAALTAGTIGGAALDVTDPEPLPEGHPLWSLPNCIITPHVGNTPEMAVPLLAERISANLHRWAAGDELLGLVDPALGY